MTPKEFFYKNFDNAVTHSMYGDNGKLLGGYIAHLTEMFPDNDVFKALRTDFSYSNDICFNEMILFLKELPYYNGTDSIYVGKLRNSMPNCYTVNSKEIDGCLICYTTGMSENVNLFALTLVSMFLGESLGVKQVVVTVYTNLLLLELERRINGWYGGKITTNLLVDIGTELLKEDNIIAIVKRATAYSIEMDTVLILHEYAHYVLRNKHIYIGPMVLLTEAVSQFIHLCEEIPEIAEAPDDEVLADLMALLLLSELYNFEEMDIISVFIAFLQLNKMSAEDRYTNKHRSRVIHYYFQNNSTYQQYKDSIGGAIDLFLSIFENAKPESYDANAFGQRFSRAMDDIDKVSSLSDEQKQRINLFYADLWLHTTLSTLEKAFPDSDSSDFETIS